MVTFSNLKYPFWPKLLGVSASRVITMSSILRDVCERCLAQNSSDVMTTLCRTCRLHSIPALEGEATISNPLEFNEVREMGTV
jgi:ribosomal protein L40E